MKLGLTKFILFLAAILSLRLEAYVINLGASGGKLVWPSTSTNLSIRVDSTNSSGLSSIEVSQILSDSANAWNEVSERQISLTTGGGVQDGSNDLFFSDDPLWFGGSSGVVGITLVSYDDNSGKIVEADIVLNDNYTFSSDNTDEFYLGNVVTHEMGHFLGISHSELARATMFYRLRGGQHTLSLDDQSAASAINPSSQGYSISGTVIGGAAKVKVFGAHVSAISLKNGEVAASAISQQDGTFVIYGLDSTDSYYLYTEPLNNISSLPSYYKDVKSNFCDSGTSYRGSFFQSCYSRSVGYPQLIQMNGSSHNVGSVTIRCGLDASPSYLSSKGGTFDFNIDSDQTGTLEATKAFVGFFSKSMIQSNQSDVIEINLPDIQSYPELAGKDIFLDVKFISQDLYSMFQYNTAATGDTLPLSLPSDDVTRFDDFGMPILDTSVQFPLLSASGSTTHEITISPKLMSDFLSSTLSHSGSYPYIPSQEDFFPAYDEGFSDGLYFYLAIASLKERQIDGSFIPVALPNNKTIYDNYACTDASRTYSVSGSVSTTSSTTSSTKKNNQNTPITCGSVDFGGGKGGPGGNPPMGMLILLGVALVASTRLREAL